MTWIEYRVIIVTHVVVPHKLHMTSEPLHDRLVLHRPACGGIMALDVLAHSNGCEGGTCPTVWQCSSTGDVRIRGFDPTTPLPNSTW